jgi:hypothetical protein
MNGVIERVNGGSVWREKEGGEMDRMIKNDKNRCVKVSFIGIGCNIREKWLLLR